MICALMIGRAGSRGLPGKNTTPILGRPLCAYPLIAANGSRYVDEVFVSTDSPEIAAIAKQYRASVIDRPPELATSSALGEDVFVHGYNEISKIVNEGGRKVELMVLLFANAPTVTSSMVDEGVDLLRQDKEVDSVVSTSVYNMWSPLRARKISEAGYLEPFVPFEVFGNPATLNCDRDSQGEVYFADMGVSVVRPHCLESIEAGLLPQKWMGKRIAALKSWGGCDVDYEWQLPMVEFWLRKNGVVEAEEKD